MNMRLANLRMQTTGLACMVLATCSCQTAQKPVALLPPGGAPAVTAQPKDARLTPTAAEPPVEKPLEQQEASKPAAEPLSLPAAPASDPAGEVIERAEKEYQAGLANFQAGKPDDAKQHFDNAFNVLLSSNLDIRSDGRLQKEFDRIVEGVNHLDLGGGMVSDDEQQQKSEPAPIDETNELAPTADPKVKAKAQAEIKSTHSDLPLMMTDQVAGFISYFSGRGRGVYERAMARSGRYHDMMVSVLKQEGVPQDLIYLAQAESGFHPLAVSRVGARGIWQFMASRARGYGLSHNMWVDDRQDPEKSTRAAARHLKDLYNQFGDWYLAMAAYNSGPGTVQAAVKRTGYADFWELYRRNVLPKETRNYVPIILAVTIMAKNPSQYGLEDVSLDEAYQFDTVTIDYPVDLRLVAQCVHSSQTVLQDLNPSLLRLSTPRTGAFELHLPPGTKEQYQAEVAAIPANMRLWWRYHTVQPGDTLASLGHSYHVTAKAISDANHLEGNQLDSDARLIIPLPPAKASTGDNGTYARRITRYKVHPGDTVERVAENFGVSPLMVRRWNGLHGNSLQGRKVLALHLPITPTGDVASSHTSTRHTHPGSKTTQTASAKPPATKSAKIEKDHVTQVGVVRHKVRSGETLYSIASYYKTSVSALRRDNGDIGTLRPGMILIVQLSR